MEGIQLIENSTARTVLDNPSQALMLVCQRKAHNKGTLKAANRVLHAQLIGLQPTRKIT
jgi:hypothetical protein